MSSGPISPEHALANRTRHQEKERNAKTFSSWLVHEFYFRRMEQALRIRRAALDRRFLRQHGAGDGARLLRLHHARRHVDDIGFLWRHDGSLSQACHRGAETRSGAACRVDWCEYEQDG